MRMGIMGRGLLMFAASLFGATSPAISASPTYYGSGGGLPFSEAVQVGDMLFLAGQIGVAPGTVILGTLY